MKRIRVNAKCVADHHAQKDREKIIEFFDPITRKGGLVAFWRTERNQILIQPYRLDAGVFVCNAEQSGGEP